MTLQNDRQLENTRHKLREIEERYDLRRMDTDVDPDLLELTLFSLKKIINQLKEEIARYEASRRTGVRS